MFSIRAALPSPNPATRRPRPGGPAAIVQGQWHATRGATSMDRQVAATESWFGSAANVKHPPGHPRAGQFRGWGGSAEYVVGPDYRLGGRIAIVRFGDPYNEYSSWSAGFAGAGTLGAAMHGVAIEVAQPMGKDRFGNYVNDPDANFEPFTDETIDACVWLATQISRDLRDLGVEPIPATHLDTWAQLPNVPVPAGHIGHDELANGLTRGKHDPGHLFPWDDLIRRINAADMIPPPAGRPDYTTLRALEEVVDVKTRAALEASRQAVKAVDLLGAEIDRLDGGR